MADVLEILETRVDNLEAESKTRLKIHDANAQAMREFANTNNQLTDLLNKQIDKVSILERKEAIQDVMIDNTNKMMLEFKTFAKEVLHEMSSIKTAILESATKSNTWRDMRQTAFQILVASGIIITAMKYIFEFLK